MLIKCPECGTSVSNKAKNCPSCAYPISEPLTKPKEGEGCFLQTLNAGCMVIAVIIGLLVLLYFVYS